MWWQLCLSKYDMKIHHVSEREMIIADNLSQINEPSVYIVSENNAEFTLSALTVKEISAEDHYHTADSLNSNIEDTSAVSDEKS